MNATRPSFLSDDDLRLLLFGGKGGVGKTSCAVATALALAETHPGEVFHLVSTDPAHSVADSLAGLERPSNLRLTELDAPACFQSFWRQHGTSLETIATRGTFLDARDIHSFLHLSLPGLDELMAALEIARWVEARPRCRLVVDTAPAGHTLRLLAMPGLLRQWLAALDALLAKHRYLKQLYGRSGQPDKAEEMLTELAASTEALESLLRDGRHCRFVPVLLAEELSYHETGGLLGQLDQWHIPVEEIIVNRLIPENRCSVCGEWRRRQAAILERILTHPQFARGSLWGVPLYPDEVRGAGALKTFWDGTWRLTGVALPSSAPRVSGGPRVEGEIGDCPVGRRLWIFAGKGGVGKTTLACASSVRLARENPRSEVLLFSTDPAHSLSTCLNTPVGSTATRILPGLTALEIDAEAEFASLKRLYAEELESFLTAALPGVDLTFDRTAMEKLLDLAPPGLDEVMALTRATELLEQGPFQTLVLDAAPTGHLLRLLEMPELVDRWLKVFFGLFLKYRRVFRLPQIAQRMVDVSRHLKRWQSLVVNPAQSTFHAVTILTELALEETKDLLAACRRMALPVSTLFLNCATPPGPCPLCTALHGRERAVLKKFQKAFPNLPYRVIYRQAEPLGLPALEKLAEALYASPVEPIKAYA